MKTVCPECNEVIEASDKFCRCCGAGKSWNKGKFTPRSQEKPKAVPSISFPPAPQYCQWGNGDQCKYPATISRSTGGGGPYFCRFHFHEMGELEGSQIASESRAQANRHAYYHPAKTGKTIKIPEDKMNIARESVKRKPGLAWALKILERNNKGELQEWYPLKLAKQALELDRAREPGEDD